MREATLTIVGDDRIAVKGTGWENFQIRLEAVSRQLDRLELKVECDFNW